MNERAEYAAVSFTRLLLRTGTPPEGTRWVSASLGLDHAPVQALAEAAERSCAQMRRQLAHEQAQRAARGLPSEVAE
jgi:hypothetical protein